MDAHTLSNDAFEERFMLLGRMEILALLQDLLHRREPLSVEFNRGRDGVLTQLLNVRSEGFVFDRSPDEAVNQRLLACEKVVFRARPDGVPVHFFGAAPQRVSWDGGEALWLPLPDRVVRMQRREAYRVTAPVAKPLVVAVKTATGESFRQPLHDLSVEGFGLSIPGETPFPAPGTALPVISIHLPDQQWLELKGEVRHLTAVGNTAGKPRWRAGIALRTVDRSSDASLQRLVIRLDQEHHKLVRED